MSSPASRDPRDKGPKHGKYMEYSENRRAFLNLPSTSFVLFTDPRPDNPDIAANVVVKIAKFNGASVLFNMTQFTAEEVAALREFFLVATATALPAAQFMDEKAEEELDNDIDSDPRLYRDVPRLFVREGEKFRDHPSILRGHEWSDDFPSYESTARVGHAKRKRRSPVPQSRPQADGTDNGEAEAGGD